MHGRRAWRDMLNQLRNNILRNSRKVIRREVRRGVEIEVERLVKEATFRKRLRWLLGWGDLRDVVEEPQLIPEETS